MAKRRSPKPSNDTGNAAGKDVRVIAQGRNRPTLESRSRTISSGAIMRDRLAGLPVPGEQCSTSEMQGYLDNARDDSVDVDLG